MTDRDPRPGSSGPPGDGALEGTSPTVRVDVPSYLAEQARHRLAAMVAGDVRMQVLPDAFDAVGVGAVGRQEVQHDTTAEGVEDLAGASRGVHAVVVEDKMDTPCAPVAAGEQPEQLAEERDVLVGGAGGVQAPGAHVERPGEVELLVLSRRDDSSLVTAQHPV